jgi:hypothetical protein
MIAIPNSPKSFSFWVKYLFTTLSILLLSVSLSYSQQQIKQHNVKDRIDVGGGQFVEILQIRGSGQNEEWYVQYYRGQVAESTPRWENSESLKIAEQRILDRNKQETTPNNTPAKNMVDKAPQKNNNKVAVDNADCSFNPPAPGVLSTDKFSIGLAKRKIYDTYAKNVNGTGMAPLKVGVTFISISAGVPYKNTVSVDPGRGAERKYDGAPVGATLYPVFSKHITCEQYRDATNKTSVEGSSVCFKNKDGNWACPILGFPKTTSL